MLTFHSILDFLREAGLRCTGSPHSRTRQLAALRRLDARLLKDIGLTPEEAKQAIARPPSRNRDKPPASRFAGPTPTVKPYPNR
jgi:uncharacterized protein YjiS (DUF1127 family)